MKMYVKHMLSFRCREKIERELEKWGIIAEVNQGMIDFQNELSFGEAYMLKEGILDLGFEIADDAESRLLDRISETISGLVDHYPEIPAEEYPDYLKEDLGFVELDSRDLFSQVHGVGVRRFAMVQQVERIKEMILYEDRNPKEVAEIFHFKNGTQLTHIFQKVTGLKPSFYKQIRKERKEVRELNGFV